MVPSDTVFELPEHDLALLLEEQEDATTTQSPDQVIAELVVTSMTTSFEPEGGAGTELGPVPLPAGAECVVPEFPVVVVSRVVVVGVVVVVVS